MNRDTEAGCGGVQVADGQGFCVMRVKTKAGKRAEYGGESLYAVWAVNGMSF